MVLLAWQVLMPLAIVVARVSLSHACFLQVQHISTSARWLQATGVYSHLIYQADVGDGADTGAIRVFSHSHHTTSAGKFRMSMSLTCLRAVAPNQVMVRVEQPKSSPEFRCLRFESLTEGVLRISKTPAKSSMKEVNCRTDPYKPDEAPLLDERHTSGSCPIATSYQASLLSPSSPTKPCHATIQFVCEQNRSIVTFGPTCKSPLAKHMVKTRSYQFTFHLSCAGGWSPEEGTKIVVLRGNEDVPSVWCLQLTGKDDKDEMLNVFINFDGRCNFPSPKDDKKSLSSNVMYGQLASFVSSRDRRCTDKRYIYKCQHKDNCEETNSCPLNCKRCFDIPKKSACNFDPAKIGRWVAVNSSEQFNVDIGKTSLTTSRYGEFSCYYGEEGSPMVTSLVRLGSHDSCAPLYACVQAFSIAPGIITFYFRHSALYTASVNPMSCDKTNDIFKKYPSKEGKMLTLFNEEKLKKTACGFGEGQQFLTKHRSCLLNVEDCSGPCDTMNVSRDNDTCHDEGFVLPVARSHRCVASLKFQDGIRGLLTYSDELEKYLCWIYTSSRLFVTEPHMCNYEAVNGVFRDKKSIEKYDPIKAFTVVPLTAPSLGSSPQINLLMFIWMLLCAFSVKSLL